MISLAATVNSGGGGGDGRLVVSRNQNTRRWEDWKGRGGGGVRGCGPGTSYRVADVSTRLSLLRFGDTLKLQSGSPAR